MTEPAKKILACFRSLETLRSFRWHVVWESFDTRNNTGVDPDGAQWKLVVVDHPADLDMLRGQRFDELRTQGIDPLLAEQVRMHCRK